MGGFFGNIKIERIGSVIWDEDRCRFIVEWKSAYDKNDSIINNSKYNEDLTSHLDIEVIGNIYENNNL